MNANWYSHLDPREFLLDDLPHSQEQHEHASDTHALETDTHAHPVKSEHVCHFSGSSQACVSPAALSDDVLRVIYRHSRIEEWDDWGEALFSLYRRLEPTGIDRHRLG